MTLTDEFRLVEGYGNHNEKRWEVQRKYNYCNSKGELVYDWSLVFHSVNKEWCEEVLEKYRNSPYKNHKIDFADTLKYFN